MSTTDFIIGLFYRGDLVIGHLPKHPHARLHPSEIVTLALLFALKGGEWPGLLPLVASRRRRLVSGPARAHPLFAAHRDWGEYVLAHPTTLGVIDSSGIALVHPWREHRTDGQLGTKGLSNHRWIIGGKLVYVVNQLGQIVAWWVTCVVCCHSAKDGGTLPQTALSCWRPPHDASSERSVTPAHR